MGSTEEHALPTENNPAGEAAIPQSQAYRNARLWVLIDGAEHRLQKVLDKLEGWAIGLLKNKAHSTAEGPNPDFNPGDEIIRDLTRALINLRHLPRRGPQNGDSGGPQWGTVLSAVAIVLTVLGAWWGLSNRLGTMDGKFDSVNTKIDAVQQAQIVETQQRAAERAEMLELIRQANERINRLEDRDRRTGYTNP